MIEVRYNLNMVPDKGSPIHINVSQNDDKCRTFIFKLYSSDGSWTAPASATATIEGRKDDGKFFSFACTYSNGEVTVVVQQQMVVVAGKVRCKIKLVSGAETIESAPFYFVVNPKSMPVNADMSKSDVVDAVAKATQKIVDQVAESIPEDYVKLNEDVSGLKSDLTDFYESGEQIKFEQGWFDVSTGEDNKKLNRCKIKLLLKQRNRLAIKPNGFCYNVLIFGKNGDVKLYYNDWMSTVGDVLSFDEDTLLAVGVKKIDDTNIAPGAVTTSVCIQFPIVDEINPKLNDVKEKIDNITNIKHIFNGNYQQYMVNNNIFTSRDQCYSYCINMKANAKYDISVIGGTYNRFRIYGSNEKPIDGTRVTEIYKAKTVDVSSGNKYTYVNDETYKYLIVFLAYDAETIDWKFDIIETIGENEFTIQGMRVPLWEDLKETNDKLEELHHNDGYSSCEYEVMNAVIDPNKHTITNDASAYALHINRVVTNMYYKIILPFHHNRLIVYGSEDGETYVEVGRLPNNYETEHAEYTVFNEKYKSLFVSIWYNTYLIPLESIKPNIYVNKDDEFSKFIVRGIQVATYEDLKKISKDIEEMSIGFDCKVSEVKNIGTISNDGKGLCLVCQKQIYRNGEMPNVTGYLYLDIYTNKLYYSATTPDNPEYLCDWDSDIVKQLGQQYINPKYWHFSITKDGDIICLLNYERCKPIVYPHENYNNPVIVDGIETNPYGLLTQQSIVQMDDGTFYFGEYTTHKLSDEQKNDRRNIWKVTKPYTKTSSWTIDHSFKHVFFESPESNEPDNEIGHIHSVTYDWYTNTLYANTGDIGRHVRIWKKKLIDADEQWLECVHGTGNGQETEEEQKFRVVNLLYTKDACWWATDSFRKTHNLYRASRNSNGDIDFSTTQKIVSLENFDGRSAVGTQATYINILLRNPNGILFIDRAEPRTDRKLDIVFYSFEKGKAYICKTFDKVPESNGLFNMGDKAGIANRVGFPNQCGVGYQPFNTDFVMIGGATHIRMNQVDLFNNSPDNYVGAIKLEVTPN